MGAITALIAGVPVSDLDASIDWYTRFFGRPPGRAHGRRGPLGRRRARDALHRAQPGAGRITFAVAALMETYSNGVRHVKVPDPDGNAIAFAEPPGSAVTSS